VRFFKAASEGVFVAAGPARTNIQYLLEFRNRWIEAGLFTTSKVAENTEKDSPYAKLTSTYGANNNGQSFVTRLRPVTTPVNV
jgi:hypothetical protein